MFLWAWINYSTFHKAGCCVFSHPADNRYHSFLFAARWMQYLHTSTNSGGKYLALQLLTAAKCSPTSRKLCTANVFVLYRKYTVQCFPHVYFKRAWAQSVFLSLFMRVISPAATRNKAIKWTKLTWRTIDAHDMTRQMVRYTEPSEKSLLENCLEKGRHLKNILGRGLDEPSVFQRLPRANFNQSGQQQEGLFALTEAKSREERKLLVHLPFFALSSI